MVGVVLALVVLGVVIGAIAAEVLGRQRQLAASTPWASSPSHLAEQPGGTPGQGPLADAGAKGRQARLVARMLAVGLAALALSVAGSAVLARAALAEQESVFLSAFAASMALVAAATVVGTLWAGPNLAVGSAVGLTLGPLPLSVIFWVLLQADRDPQAPIAGFIVTFIALAVSGAAWAATIGIARAHRKGRSNGRP